MIRRYAVEIFVIAILVLTAGGVMVGGYSRYARGHNPTAVREAKEWAAAHNVNVGAITCANEDLNLDGYVMCVVMTKDRTLLAIDCPVGLWGKTGCHVNE